MEHKKQNSDEKINRHFSEKKQKFEGAKFLSRIEELQSEIKSQFQVIQNEIHNLVTGQTHQDELNNNLMAELHQIGEMLQKVDNAHQLTQRNVNNHEKEIKENRHLIRKIETEVQKFKSVLRID